MYSAMLLAYMTTIATGPVVDLGQSEVTTGRLRSLRCGSYCLYVSLKGLGFQVGSFNDVEQQLGQPSATGYSLLQLEQTARHFGAHTLMVETTLDHLKKRTVPFACIARIDGSHFVNVYDISADEVFVIDPPQEYAFPKDTFCGLWDGSALLISTAPLDLNETSRVPVLLWGALGSVIVVVIFLFRRRLIHAITG